MTEDDIRLVNKQERDKAREHVPWVHFHWQNLNEHTDASGNKYLGNPLREGRCWWHFRSGNSKSKAKWSGPSVCFSWNLWTHFCMLEADIDDEDLTFHVGLPPVALWLSFSSTFWFVDKLARKKVLNKITYPTTIVIDERECGVSISDWTLRVKPWCKKHEWVRDDPWYVRGVNLNLNPFRWKHIAHQVLDVSGNWVEYIGLHVSSLGGDTRHNEVYDYTYTCKDGTVQHRSATVHVERMTWRPGLLTWTKLFERSRVYFDIRFDKEIGEGVGSYKGGCVSCSYEMLNGETMEQCLRRMEKVRKFK